MGMGGRINVIAGGEFSNSVRKGSRSAAKTRGEPPQKKRISKLRHKVDTISHGPSQANKQHFLPEVG